jgi:hypothetical protein
MFQRRVRMSARRLLWLGFVVAVPVPVLVVGQGHVPALRLLFMGGVTLAVILFESARGAAVLLAAFLIGQFAVYAGVLWLAAAVITRVAGRWRLAAAIAILVALFAVTLTRPIYRCPFLPVVSRVSLLGVYR